MAPATKMTQTMDFLAVVVRCAVMVAISVSSGPDCSARGQLETGDWTRFHNPGPAALIPQPFRAAFLAGDLPGLKGCTARRRFSRDCDWRLQTAVAISAPTTPATRRP